MRRSLAAVILMATTITLDAQSLDFNPNYPDTVNTCQGEAVTIAISAISSNIEEYEATSTGNVAYGPRVQIDQEGNKYILGTHTGSFTLGGTTLVSNGSEDVYIAKIDALGQVVWIVSGGSNKPDTPSGLALHPDGGVIASGSHLNTITFYGTNQSQFIGSFTPSSNSGHRDGFALKLSADGVIEWGVTLNGGSNEYMADLTTDTSGNVYLTGGFNHCCPSTFNATVNGSVNSVSITSFGSNYGSGVLVKLNAQGQVQWTNTYHNRDTGGGPVVVDDAGNVYTSGSFRSWSNGTPLIHVDATGSQHSISNPGIGRAFLIKVDANGQWAWGRSFGNNGADSWHAIWASAIDLSGNELRIVGYYYSGTVYFENSSGLTLPAQTNRVGYALKYDTDGTFIDAAVVNPNGNGDNYLSRIDRNGSRIAGRSSGSDQTPNQGGLDAFFGDFDWNSLTLTNIQTFGSAGDDAVTGIATNNGAVHIGIQLASSGAFPSSISGVSGGVLLSSTSSLPEDVIITWEDGSNDNPYSFSPDSSSWLQFTLTQGATTFTDSIRLELTPPACDDPEAANFEASASCYGGPCSYLGCTDISACNYDSEAVMDESKCIYFQFTPLVQSTICSADTIELEVMLSGDLPEPNWNVLETQSVNFGDYWTIEWPLEVGKEYRLNVSGTYSAWSNGCADFAYWCNNTQGAQIGMPHDGCSPGIAHNLPLRCIDTRPDNDTYDATSHSYDYTFTSDTTILQIQFSDCSWCFGDNSGSLTFQLEESDFTNIHSAIGWSNNSAGTSTAFTLDSTTWIVATYNYSEGICSDSTLIEVQVGECSDPNACNYNPLAACTNGVCIPSGCMEEGACNYNADAQCEGEACDYSCCPGPGCCGPGTTWDPQLQTCIAETPPTETAENCTLFNLQELSIGYLQLAEQNAAQDTLIITQQAAIDSLNALLNNCTGND